MILQELESSFTVTLLFPQSTFHIKYFTLTGVGRGTQVRGPHIKRIVSNKIREHTTTDNTSCYCRYCKKPEVFVLNGCIVKIEDIELGNEFGALSVSATSIRTKMRRENPNPKPNPRPNPNTKASPKPNPNPKPSTYPNLRQKTAD